MPKIKELIQPPPEPEGSGEQQIAALRDYLVKITQELYYLLTHLEADNINDSTFQRISEMIPKPYVGQPLMDGTASSGGSGNWSRGDHRHPADTSKADVTALEEEAALLAAHVGDHTNPHEVTAAQVGLGNVANERQYSAQNPPPLPTPSAIGAQAEITASGILKGDGAGGVATATAGTDYGTYSKPSGGIPASDLASGVVPSASDATPQALGTAAAGSSNDYSRADHVHQMPEIPSNVEANPVGAATDTLTKLQVDQTIYSIDGIDYLTVVNGQICVVYEVTP